MSKKDLATSLRCAPDGPAVMRRSVAIVIHRNDDNKRRNSEKIFMHMYKQEEGHRDVILCIFSHSGDGTCFLWREP